MAISIYIRYLPGMLRSIGCLLIMYRYIEKQPLWVDNIVSAAHFILKLLLYADHLRLIIVKQKNYLHLNYENVNDKHTEYSRHR